MRILTRGEYYGARRGELAVGGVVLSEYDYLQDRTEWHYHENPYFMYVLRGGVYDTSRRGTTHCPAGSLVFHNWQERHYNHLAGAGAAGFHVEFGREWFARHRLDAGLWDGSGKLDDPLLHLHLGRLRYEFHRNDELTPLGTEAALLGLCEGVAGRHPGHRTPAWGVKLREILHAEHEEPPRLATLAAALNVHPVHLSRSAARYLGTTISEYVRRLRLARALEVLPDAGHSLGQVAHHGGFYDQSHFGREFRAWFGVSPGAYRRAANRKGKTGGAG